MAFMVPLVKNHYDIYARNNPADHSTQGGTGTGKTSQSNGGLLHDPHSNSLILSATSLGKSGAPVKKQYRIILTGGQVVNGAGGGGKKKTPGVNSTSAGNGGTKYYRMPSASISLPVNSRGPRGATQAAPKGGGGGGGVRRSSKSTSEAGVAGCTGGGTRSTPTSPDRSSSGSGSPPHFPGSRPPHLSSSICQPTSGSFRRSPAAAAAAKSPTAGSRVYSYSVSIPEYVPEEKEKQESLEISLLAGDDKENCQEEDLLSIFATSAPGGTGALEEVMNSSSSSKVKKIKKKPLLVQKSASLSAASSPPIEVEITTSAKPPLHSTNSTPSSPPLTPSSPPSREYIELLRKFILHLKMLKIGNNSKQSSKSKQNSIKSTNSSSGGSVADGKCSLSTAAVDGSEVASSVLLPEDSTAPKRARKRKDTMEDSKDL